MKSPDLLVSIVLSLYRLCTLSCTFFMHVCCVNSIKYEYEWVHMLYWKYNCSCILSRLRNKFSKCYAILWVLNNIMLKYLALFSWTQYITIITNWKHIFLNSTKEETPDGNSFHRETAWPLTTVCTGCMACVVDMTHEIKTELARRLRAHSMKTRRIRLNCHTGRDWQLTVRCGECKLTLFYCLLTSRSSSSSLVVIGNCFAQWLGHCRGLRPASSWLHYYSTTRHA